VSNKDMSNGEGCCERIYLDERVGESKDLLGCHLKRKKMASS
jgi:hypothetical protein